jgi:Flp pilus assembly protein TadG
MNNRKKRRGAAALELALVLPILIVLALWCVDYGRYAYYSIGVQNAARAAAEYAIMNPYTTSGKAAWSSAVTQAARDEMTNQTGYTSGSLTVTVQPVTFEKTTGLPVIQLTATYTGFTTANWPGIPQNPTLTSSIYIRGIR